MWISIDGISAFLRHEGPDYSKEDIEAVHFNITDCRIGWTTNNIGDAWGDGQDENGLGSSSRDGNPDNPLGRAEGLAPLAAQKVGVEKLTSIEILSLLSI